MTNANNWYVLTGGPSTGKSTLLTSLQDQRHATVPEAARTVIDEGLANGISVSELRADEKQFQTLVADRKAAIEARISPDQLTFFDRGMHDTLAYFRYYDFPIEDQVRQYLKAAHYRQVFLLEPLDVYREDYSRTEDEDFTKQLHQLLYDAYKEYGMEPTLVPAMGISDRTDFILQAIKQEQVV